MAYICISSGNTIYVCDYIYLIFKDIFIYLFTYFFFENQNCRNKAGETETEIEIHDPLLHPTDGINGQDRVRLMGDKAEWQSTGC